MIFIGVDPGLTGAIAVITSDGNANVWQMPVRKFKNYKGTMESKIDLSQLNGIISDIKTTGELVFDCPIRERDNEVFMIIEIQMAYHHYVFGKDEATGKSIIVDERIEGTSSSFKIGYGFAAVEMCAVANKIPYKLIGAKKWQNQLFPSIKSGGTKKTSLEVAKKLYPDVSLKTISDKTGNESRIDKHGMADALLIAHYARITHNIVEKTCEAFLGPRKERIKHDSTTSA